jgi:hypothetical protein
MKNTESEVLEATPDRRWVFYVAVAVLFGLIFGSFIERTTAPSEENLRPALSTAEAQVDHYRDLAEKFQVDYANVANELNPLRHQATEAGDRAADFESLSLTLSDEKLALEQELFLLTEKMATRWPVISEILKRSSHNGLGIEFTDGSWLVGVDVAYGVYKNVNPPLLYDDSGKPFSECGWSVHDELNTGWYSDTARGSDELLAIVELSEGDLVFSSHYCGWWVRIQSCEGC